MPNLIQQPVFSVSTEACSLSDWDWLELACRGAAFFPRLRFNLFAALREVSYISSKHEAPSSLPMCLVRVMTPITSYNKHNQFKRRGTSTGNHEVGRSDTSSGTGRGASFEIKQPEHGMLHSERSAGSSWPGVWLPCNYLPIDGRPPLRPLSFP